MDEKKHRELPQLSDELIYQIIFCMEDQSQEYVLDLEDGTIQQIDLLPPGLMDEDPDRFSDLPYWLPADGFRIMEKFIATLRNPVYRERLQETLSQGKGVFRSFKNVLKEEPAVERLWFYFKEREMKRIIASWYGRLQDALSMELLGDEPEEDTSELILTDFTISDDAQRFESYVRTVWDRRLEQEFSSLPSPLDMLLVMECRDSWDRWDEDWIRLFLESPAGETAGFIAAEPRGHSRSDLLYEVRQFYVEPKFRGLGVFSMLCEELCRRTSDAGAAQLIMQVSGRASFLHLPLERRGFAVIQQRLALDLSHWASDGSSPWI